MQREARSTLAERVDAVYDPAPREPAAASPAAQPTQRRRTGVPAHRWVSDPAATQTRVPGMLTAWRRRGETEWDGRVTYAVTDEAGDIVIVEAWVTAEHLSRA